MVSFDLIVGDKRAPIGAFGFCTDALGDLVRAALLLATCANSAEVHFDGEPFEWRLSVYEGWKKEALLRVEANRDVVLEDRVAADGFARAVQKVAPSLWDTHGAVGYNEAWHGNRGFPLRALRALDAALSNDEPAAYR